MNNQLETNTNYIQSLEKAVKDQLFYLLQASDGLFAMFEDASDNTYVPVWSASEKAILAAKEEWTDYSVTEMELKELLSWLDELQEDQINIGAFPDDSLQVTPLKPELFKEHILEMKQATS